MVLSNEIYLNMLNPKGRIFFVGANYSGTIAKALLEKLWFIFDEPKDKYFSIVSAISHQTDVWGLNDNTKTIDLATSAEIATLINNEDKMIPFIIEKAIDLGYKTIKSGGRIIYIGAGTSGRLGVLDSAEMLPTYNLKENTVISLLAGGKKAMFNPVEGAEDNKLAIVEQLEEENINNKDLIIGISASGRTISLFSRSTFCRYNKNF